MSRDISWLIHVQTRGSCALHYILDLGERIDDYILLLPVNLLLSTFPLLRSLVELQVDNVRVHVALAFVLVVWTQFQLHLLLPPLHRDTVVELTLW